MIPTTALKSPRRGRPSTQLQRHVCADLIRATEQALDKKMAREITVREISSAAGTSEAMIRYYFGGKDGLLLEVIKEFMDRAPIENSADLTAACIAARSLRPLVSSLCAFLYSRPSMVKMLSVELFSASSEVKKLFRSKYGSCVNQLIEQVVDRMKEAGIYKTEVNANFVAMTLIRLIVSPIMESAVTGTTPLTDEVRSGEWEDFMANLIDTIST